MEPEIVPIKTMPDAASEEKVFYWANVGRWQRAREKAEYESKHYDRLAIYAKDDILDMPQRH